MTIEYPYSLLLSLSLSSNRGLTLSRLRATGPVDGFHAFVNAYGTAMGVSRRLIEGDHIHILIAIMFLLKLNCFHEKLAM